MPLGVKGVKALKDGGIKESIVSTDKYAVMSLNYHQSSLIDFINPFSL
jgi:hypothetical protein